MIALKGDGRLFTTHVLGCGGFGKRESDGAFAYGWLLHKNVVGTTMAAYES